MAMSFVCTGHKIWTTHAHEANWMFCLVRTDGSGKPQQGITFLLIDMTAPGVRVEPIIMSSGEHIQNTVYFDEVRVPKTNVVGAVGAGWGVAKYLLEFERGGTAYGPKLLARLDGLRRAARELGADIAPQLARAEIACRALEAAELRLMAELSPWRHAGAESLDDEGARHRAEPASHRTWPRDCGHLQPSLPAPAHRPRRAGGRDRVAE